MVPSKCPSKIECGKYTSNFGKNNVKANWQRIKAEGRLKLQRPTEASRPTLSKVAVPPLPLVPTQKMSVTSFRKASAIISWPIIEHCTIPTQNTRNMILIAYEYIDQEAPGASLSPPLRSKNSSPKTGPTLALTSPSGIENLTFKFYKLFIKYFKSTIATMIYIANTFYFLSYPGSMSVLW